MRFANMAVYCQRKNLKKAPPLEFKLIGDPIVDDYLKFSSKPGSRTC